MRPRGSKIDQKGARRRKKEAKWSQVEAKGSKMEAKRATKAIWEAKWVGKGIGASRAGGIPAGCGED